MSITSPQSAIVIGCKITHFFQTDKTFFRFFLSFSPLLFIICCNSVYFVLLQSAKHPHAPFSSVRRHGFVLQSGTVPQRCIHVAHPCRGAEAGMNDNCDLERVQMAVCKWLKCRLFAFFDSLVGVLQCCMWILFRNFAISKF